MRLPVITLLSDKLGAVSRSSGCHYSTERRELVLLGVIADRIGERLTDPCSVNL